MNGETGNASAGVDSGAAYVFTRDEMHGSQSAYVKASNAQPEDFFGMSIALSADGAALAVGAWFEDSNTTGVGGDLLY